MAKKLIALLISVMLIAVSIPFAYAAEAAVEMHNGQRTVFVSAFGRLNYDGETRTAFKNFNDALKALGKEGGKIVLTGVFDMTDFDDIEDRGPITIVGAAALASAATLSFPATVKSISFEGDTYLENLTIQTEPDVPIYTNGHIFEVSNSTTSFFTETYVADGDNIITYKYPFVIASGDLGGADSDRIKLSSGMYKAVAGGAVGGNAEANTNIVIMDGTYEGIYGGNFDSTGTFTGNSNIEITGGKIDKIVAGSQSGKFNGNIFLTISDGNIGVINIGSTDASAKVNGNVVLRINGTPSYAIGASNKSTISGKLIFIADKENAQKLSGASADYIITEENTTVTPVFQGSSLLGFNIVDEYGFLPNAVYANGSKITPKGEIFTLPAGKVSVSCEANTAIVVDRNASYVAGYADGTFLPENNMTRAEAITLLSRIITPDISALGDVVSCDYTDVAPTDWYAGVIGFFQKLGYLEKLELEGGTIINPNAQITRAEFAELSANVLYLIYEDTEFGMKTFSDVPANNKYLNSIGVLGYLGIIGGYPDGTFGPENNIKRSEVVTIVNRMLGRTPTGAAGSVSFYDVVGHWAEPQVVTACNPATVGSVAVWTVTDDITKGSYTLLDADVTVGEQIKNYYQLYKNGQISPKDAIYGVDVITQWQIDNIVNSQSQYPTTGKVYYISNNGNDANDGLTPATAWQTLTRLKERDVVFGLKPGDTILFERGGVWRGTFSATKGVTYSAYGEGAKPIISGSVKNYADPALWTETETPNVYKLNELIKNVGVIVFDDTTELGNYNEIVGVMDRPGLEGIETYADMTQDLHYYNDLITNEFYLYCEGGNPGERFKSIEIGANQRLVTSTNTEGVVIDNLRFRHSGGHAIGFTEAVNTTVRNCIVDYVGGAVMNANPAINAVRYGNAIELYGPADGWYLYDNWCYQIFDTGITNQYNSSDSKGNCHMTDVRYIGNVMEYCHWAIEWYNYDYSTSKHSCTDILYKDNICRLTGYGWGSIHRKSGSAALESWGNTNNTSDFVIENNIFDRSAGLIFDLNASSGMGQGNKEITFRDNVYVQKYEKTLGNFFGSRYSANASATTYIEKLLEDTTSIIYFNDDTSVNNYTPNIK